MTISNFCITLIKDSNGTNSNISRNAGASIKNFTSRRSAYIKVMYINLSFQLFTFLTGCKKYHRRTKRQDCFSEFLEKKNESMVYSLIFITKPLI